MEHVHDGLKIRDNWLLFVFDVGLVVAAIDVSVVTVAILLIPLPILPLLITDELLLLFLKFFILLI